MGTQSTWGAQQDTMVFTTSKDNYSWNILGVSSKGGDGCVTLNNHKYCYSGSVTNFNNGLQTMVGSITEDGKKVISATGKAVTKQVDDVNNMLGSNPATWSPTK